MDPKKDKWTLGLVNPSTKNPRTTEPKYRLTLGQLDPTRLRQYRSTGLRQPHFQFHALPFIPSSFSPLSLKRNTEKILQTRTWELERPTAAPWSEDDQSNCIARELENPVIPPSPDGNLFEIGWLIDCLILFNDNRIWFRCISVYEAIWRILVTCDKIWSLTRSWYKEIMK